MTVSLIKPTNEVRPMDYFGRLYATRRVNNICYLPLNDTALVGGWGVRDYSVFDYTKQVNGSISLGYPGPFGWFPGVYYGGTTGTYINLISLNGLITTWGGTITFMVKCANWQEGVAREFYWFYVDGNNYMFADRQVSGNVHFAYRGAGVYVGVNTGVIPSSRKDWVSFAVTWNIPVSSYLKCYVDGVLVDSATGLSVGSMGLGSATLGSSPNIPGTTDNWLGGLSHFSVWTTALTDSEILSIGGVRK